MADKEPSLTDTLLRYADKATRSLSDAWEATMNAPETISKETYDYVISQGGTEEQARKIADRLEAKAGRTTGLLDFLVPQSASDVAFMAAGPLGLTTKAGKAALGAGSALMVMDPEEAQAGALTRLGKGLSKFVEGSVLRNAEGEPTRLYHGSKSDIEYFNPFHADRKDTGWMGRGVYAFDNPAGANIYAMMKRGPVGENVMPLYGRLTNPYEFTMAEKKAMSTWDQGQIDDFTNDLIAKGHDGAILKYPDGNREIVIYDPKMVKSAIGNSGDYDMTTDILTKSQGGAVKGYALGGQATGEVTSDAIRQMYNDYFGRTASDDEVNWWANTAGQQGMSLSDIGQQFANSEEGQQQQYAMLDKILGNRVGSDEDNNVTVVGQTTSPDRWTTYWGYKPTQQDYAMMLRAGLGEYGTPQSYDQYRAIYEAIGNRAAANTLAPYYVGGNKTLAGQITPSQVEGAFAASRINGLLNSDDPQKYEAVGLARQALDDYLMEGKNRVLTTQTDWRGFQNGAPSPGAGFTNALVPGGEDLPIYNRFYDPYGNPQLAQRLAQLQNQQQAIYTPPVPPTKPQGEEWAALVREQYPEPDQTTYQTYANTDPMTGNPFDTSWLAGPVAPTTFGSLQPYVDPTIDQSVEQQNQLNANARDWQQNFDSLINNANSFDLNNPANVGNYNPTNIGNFDYSGLSNVLGDVYTTPSFGINTGWDFGGWAKGGKVEKKISKVMGEFKAGELHSGSKTGPEVTNPKQAIAIALSEARHLKKGKGGEVSFKKMFEGDSEELQNRARELGREAYSGGIKNMGKEKAQEWEALARKYNLPVTVGPFDNYEDQYSDALSNWQRNVSPKQREHTFDEGGPVKIEFTETPAFEFATPAMSMKNAEPSARDILAVLAGQRSGEEGPRPLAQTNDPAVEELQRLTALLSRGAKAPNVAMLGAELGNGEQARGRVVQAGPYIDIGGGVTIPMRDAILMLDASYGKVPGTAMRPNLAARGELRLPFEKGGKV